MGAFGIALRLAATRKEEEAKLAAENEAKKTGYVERCKKKREDAAKVLNEFNGQHGMRVDGNKLLVKTATGWHEVVSYTIEDYPGYTIEPAYWCFKPGRTYAALSHIDQFEYFVASEASKYM